MHQEKRDEGMKPRIEVLQQSRRVGVKILKYHRIPLHVISKEVVNV